MYPHIHLLLVARNSRQIESRASHLSLPQVTGGCADTCKEQWTAATPVSLPLLCTGCVRSCLELAATRICRFLSQESITSPKKHMWIRSFVFMLHGIRTQEEKALTSFSQSTTRWRTSVISMVALPWIPDTASHKAPEILYTAGKCCWDQTSALVGKPANQRHIVGALTVRNTHFPLRPD